MQIEITKSVLALAGRLSEGDVLCVDTATAQMLISLGCAKERSAEVPSIAEGKPKKTKKAKKAEE